MVTAIKFSQDFKYFISGDADGVICHYVRTCPEDQAELKEDQQQLMQNHQMSASVLNSNNQASAKNLLAGVDADKYFPFTLKVSVALHLN